MNIKNTAMIPLVLGVLLLSGYNFFRLREDASLKGRQIYRSETVEKYNKNRVETLKGSEIRRLSEIVGTELKKNENFILYLSTGNFLKKQDI